MVFAGGKIHASDFNGIAIDSSEVGYSITLPASTTTSLAFVNSLADGIVMDDIFTANASGIVMVTLAANIKNSTTNFSCMAPEIRAGSTAGAGTVILAADDNYGIGCRGTDEVQMGRVLILTGLTNGQVYNARLFYKVNAASTGTFLRREMACVPV